MIILGIDPGSRNTGYGLIQFEKNSALYIASGHISIPNAPIETKLSFLFGRLKEIVEQHQPGHVAIEQIFVCQNPNSALKLGQARGIAILAATLSKASVFEYSAKQIKQAVVGYGNADKNQVQQMVKVLLKLTKVPQSDEADALAVGICHGYSYRRKERRIEK